MTFRSKLELLAAIPHIKEAPKKETLIENLCFRPERNQRSYPNFLELTPSDGIKRRSMAGKPLVETFKWRA